MGNFECYCGDKCKKVFGHCKSMVSSASRTLTDLKELEKKPKLVEAARKYLIQEAKEKEAAAKEASILTKTEAALKKTFGKKK